jgi:hypothetical protein
MKIPRLPRAFRVSRRQFVWACVGLIIVIVVAFIASGNLKVIYKAEPDFVLGSFLAAAGYCFAKASTRTNAEKALEELHRTGVVQRLRLAQRNANAALRRLSTFYHSQAESLDFRAGLDLYEVILDDVDEALANIDGVMRIVGASEETPSVRYEIAHVTRQLLLQYSRSVREALNRQRRTHEWLIVHAPPTDHPAVWDRFGNLTSDLLKAHFAMRALCAMPLRVAPEEQSVELIGYLAASDDRAREMCAALEANGLKPPDVFNTLVKDINSARRALMDARLALPDAARAELSVTP